MTIENLLSDIEIFLCLLTHARQEAWVGFFFQLFLIHEEFTHFSKIDIVCD